jgi:predicted ATPase
MYISSIRLRNWKNFKDTSAKMRQRVFVIGPNASGKSNFLDAFRFLRDVAEKGLKYAVEEARSGVSSIRCLAATRYTNIDLDVEISEGPHVLWSYQLEFNQDAAQRPTVRREIVKQNGNELLVWPGDRAGTDAMLATQTALEQISLNQSFREISDFFKAITYQHLLPQVVRDPRGFTAAPVQDDPFGRDFLLRMWRTPEKTRNSRLAKIHKALQSAVPQLSDLSVEMDTLTGTPHLVGRYEHWRPHGAMQNESQFSDGTLRLVGLLWMLFEGNGPLLMEEPEISLHPAVVEKIPSLMFRIGQLRKDVQRQIIVSTHSDDLLSDRGIAAEEILRLQPSADGTVIESASEADKAAFQSGLSAADILLPQAAPANIGQLPFAFDE